MRGCPVKRAGLNKTAVTAADAPEITGFNPFGNKKGLSPPFHIFGMRIFCDN